MARKPNIVLLFPDQQRADTLGCAGNPAAQTPVLDRLAAEGVLYSRCITNAPLCMPARASLITGQFVNEHGFRACIEAVDPLESGVYAAPIYENKPCLNGWQMPFSFPLLCCLSR